MVRRALRAAVVCAFLGFAMPATAQEFGVYTKVSRVRPPGAGLPQAAGDAVVSRSISLFHAGKVYDHTGDEVIIFEPAHDRFTLLNTSRHMATTVHLDEVKQLLKIARQETENHLVQLRQQQTPSAAEALEQIGFTLDPAFDETLDAAGTRLKVASRHLQYDVTCTRPKSPEVVDAYLRYADWAARLNYVLHPHVLFPETRLALNASLRRKKLLPVEVELRAQIGTPIHLRAQHQFHWELDGQHRALINGWEQLLKGQTTRHVTFQEYQRTLLVSQTERRR